MVRHNAPVQVYACPRHSSELQTAVYAYLLSVRTELSSTHCLRSRLWLPDASEVFDGKLPDTSGAIVVDEPKKLHESQQNSTWLSSPQSSP